jgi:hypothetical protein
VIIRTCWQWKIASAFAKLAVICAKSK